MAVLTSVRLALALAIAGVAAGCYEPELEDCTLRCSPGHGCADGHICGADGWCAAPEVAGTCDELAAAMVPVRLTIERRGELQVQGQGVGCRCEQDDDCTCDVELPQGLQIEVLAIRTDKDWDKWLTSNCDGQDASCTLTVAGPRTEIGARFKE